MQLEEVSMDKLNKDPILMQMISDGWDWVIVPWQIDVELFIQSTIEHKTEMVDALQNALGSKDAIINDALQEASEDHQQKGKGPKPMNPADVAISAFTHDGFALQI